MRASFDIVNDEFASIFSGFNDEFNENEASLKVLFEDNEKRLEEFLGDSEFMSDEFQTMLNEDWAYFNSSDDLFDFYGALDDGFFDDFVGPDGFVIPDDFDNSDPSDTFLRRRKRQTSAIVEKIPLEPCQVVTRNLANSKRNWAAGVAFFQNFTKALTSMKKVYSNFQATLLSSVDKTFDFNDLKNKKYNVNIQTYCNDATIKIYLATNRFLSKSNGTFICTTLDQYKKSVDGAEKLKQSYLLAGANMFSEIMVLEDLYRGCKKPYNEIGCSKTADLTFNNTYIKSACFVKSPLPHQDAVKKCHSFGMDAFFYELKAHGSLRSQFAADSSVDAWINGLFLNTAPKFILRNNTNVPAVVNLVLKDNSKTRFILANKFLSLTTENGLQVRPFFCEFMNVKLADVVVNLAGISVLN